MTPVTDIARYRQDLFENDLRRQPPELPRSGFMLIDGIHWFLRHINPDGKLGGWVHESSQVDSTVYVPVGTIVDRFSRITGYGHLDPDTFYAERTVLEVKPPAT
jgi:hypothetical protein